MIRDHSHRENRSAFTLVELMVVILIIAILVSLLASAVMKVMDKIPEVQTRTEISEMDVALQAFMQDYNLAYPPPSSLFLNEQFPTSTASGSFLTQVFGKNLGTAGGVDWNGDGVITPTPLGTATFTLQGSHCLVFYLGGIPNTAAVAGGQSPAPQGFSTNNTKPSYGSMPALGETSSGKRKGPYFPFVTSRLFPDATTGGFCVYLDPWQAKVSTNGVGPRPYVFFSSSGNNNGYSYLDCLGVSFTDALGAHFALPYWTGLTAIGLPTGYTYPNTYQIISAGKDGKFGYTPGALPPPGALNSNLWSPTGGAVGTGADDQANFSSTLLGVGQN